MHASSTLTQQVISLIPIINDLRNSSYSTNEILQLLHDNYNLTINNSHPDKFLNKLLSNDKHNLLNKSFNKFKLFISLPDDKVVKNSIETEYGFNFTFQETIVPEDRLITMHTLDYIFNIKGSLIAKRLIRAHSIHDSVLVNNYMRAYKTSTLPTEYIAFITNIHLNILPIFNNLVAELKKNKKTDLFNKFQFDFIGDHNVKE